MRAMLILMAAPLVLASIDGPVVQSDEQSAEFEAAPAPDFDPYLACPQGVPVFNPEACAVTEPLVPAEPCRETVREVRAEAGLPLLRGDERDASAPVMMAAVDRRVDDCAVIQVHGNPEDIRPLPAEGEARMMPVD